MMAEVKVVMWNCSGLLSTSSASEKMEFLGATSSYDILILIETHHKSLSDISTILHPHSTSYTLFHTEASPDDPYAGIAVLVSKTLGGITQSVLVPGRLINLKIDQGRGDLNLSVMYGFSGASATVDKIKRFTEILAEVHNVSDNNIVLGDFNFVDNDLDRTNKNFSGMNSKDKNFSNVWTEFTDALDLSDPFRARNPRRKMFSYIHTQHNAKSRIDRVYVNDENVSNIFHYRHTPVARWPKAHRLVSFSWKGTVERGPGYWKMNTSILSDRPYSLIVETTVKDVLDLKIDDPIERWLIFIETIRLETQVYCSRKRSHEREIKRMCEVGIERLEQNPLLARDTDLQLQHEYYASRLNDWTRKQVEGFQIRAKTQPRFEYCEPNIDFFASLEKKSSKKKLITQLKNRDGEVVYDNESLRTVATEYYTDLFSIKGSDSAIAGRLLQNIDKTLSVTDRTKLDNLITKEELYNAIMKLKRNKSPGPDGIPAEFYQRFWYVIEDLYFEYITRVENDVFPAIKNTSITTIIYKNKGDIDLLAYYRPIALMNVDIKILTKLLSMRLVTVLPSIIHRSQTALYGRTIGDNIHLVRDIIDLANKTDEDAALLFLDQEKAFDRVDHQFLYKVLEKFGFGDRFIRWIRLIYSNASTKINVNGFLTDNIPLKCGVRQGCPLSALLYVLIIEILALQLRANPNIVGFTIDNENLISSHYADDTVIKITQNRCFKEVYKELTDYEKATGARINYEKTQGLWLGKWKHRKDDPFEGLYGDSTKGIKWTSGNVKHLGIFVGNDDPVIQTFAEIIPKVKRRLNFWKPLKLPILARARVIEIFHASKLFYAANFYSIPEDMLKDITKAFIDYLNFPSKKHNVSKMEMEKLRDFGGLKLINLQLKAECPKIQWLMKLITKDHLTTHRKVFETLMGLENGYLNGFDMIFAETSYISKCKIKNSFYEEALVGISKLNTYKHYQDINDEHVFYNKIFVTTTDDDVHDKTLTPFKGNQILGGIRTYGDLLHAESTIQHPKLLAALRRKRDSIEYIRENVESHLVIGHDLKEHEFCSISQKEIYSELVHEQSRDHPYVGKWGISERFGLIEWEKIWPSVHKQFYTEQMKSSIWEQLHLNFYTTYNFNSWYNRLQPCPLCGRIPEEVTHIIVDCKFTKVLWKRVERVLVKILPKPPTVSEMAFGLQARNKDEEYPVTLRNWITFLLRHYVMQEERRMYKINLESASRIAPSFEKFFVQFNFNARQELLTKMALYASQGLSEKYEKIVTSQNAIARVENEVYEWSDLM